MGENKKLFPIANIKDIIVYNWVNTTNQSVDLTQF